MVISRYNVAFLIEKVRNNMEIEKFSGWKIEDIILIAAWEKKRECYSCF